MKKLLKAIKRHLDLERACREAYIAGYEAGSKDGKEETLTARIKPMDRLYLTEAGRLWREMSSIWDDALYLYCHAGNDQEQKSYLNRIMKTYEKGGAEFNLLLTDGSPTPGDVFEINLSE